MIVKFIHFVGEKNIYFCMDSKIENFENFWKSQYDYNSYTGDETGISRKYPECGCCDVVCSNDMTFSRFEYFSKYPNCKIHTEKGALKSNQSPLEFFKKFANSNPSSIKEVIVENDWIILKAPYKNKCICVQAMGCKHTCSIHVNYYIYLEVFKHYELDNLSEPCKLKLINFGCETSDDKTQKFKIENNKMINNFVMEFNNTI